jgi:hypothetical protein
MTLTADTLNYILSIAALFGIAFTIYKSYNNPQKKLEKRQAVADKEVEGKAHILAQQLQWEKESNERRFKELTDCFNNSNTTATNHLNHIDAKVDGVSSQVNLMNVQIIKLATIIEERIPTKKTK